MWQREHAAVRLFLVVLSAGLLLGLVSAGAREPKYNEQIRSIWNEAYEGIKEPSEVYELLKRIQQVYATLSQTGDLTYGDGERKVLYDLLYKIWTPTRDECTYEYFTQDKYLERYFLVSERNIGDYWHHCERKRAQVCEPVLEEQLKAEVDQVDVGQRENLKLLVKSIAAGNWDTSSSETRPKDKIYVAGILRYLEALEGPLSKSVLKDKSKAKDRFVGLYKRLVEEPCNSALLTGKQQLRVYDVIRRQNEQWTPKGLAKEWIDAETVCSEILFSLFFDRTFELLQETSPQKGFLDKLGIRRPTKQQRKK